MSFGPIMRVPVGDLVIELAPLSKDVMEEFVSPGMQQASISRYLARHTAPVAEDEYEWFEKTRKSSDNLIWGIYLIEGAERKLIGNTGLSSIEIGHIHQATSGSMLFRQEYWGKGIASAIHRARTWYAFQHMGLHRIRSAVIQGNVASLKALRKCGYTVVYVERNTVFVDGMLRHQDNLECLNPQEPFWGQWWGNNKPTKRSLEARSLTQTVMDWAEQNVELL